MSTPRLKIANLDEASLTKVKQMEEAFGALILAFEPYHPVADLTEEQVKKIRQLEQELGATLIAYQR